MPVFLIIVIVLFICFSVWVQVDIIDNLGKKPKDKKEDKDE